ncbi:MAG: TolC family protein [Pirellulaceae bacterium]|nr:TolC family protein [Pirellulaceae bacterium]
MSVRGGMQRNGRRGTQLGLTQELGTLDSNSTFFEPADQGNARLSLSLTQPLLARGGQVYNERLLTRARIDSRVTWQEMRGDVETRIAEVMSAYWRLYEVRCHLLQQRQLLARGERIEQILAARDRFDAGPIELAKARQRVARRQDQLVVIDADVKKRQTRLATLIGSDVLCGAESRLELIPQELPIFPDQRWDVRDVMVQTLENRPEIKSATSQLEAAGLAIRVTRTELVPQLNAVVNASLSSLNGDYRVARSWTDQFSGITPGFSAGLQYEMPHGRRAARSRHREAQHQYRQRAESLREIIQQTKWEAEAALIDVRRASAQHDSKRHLLLTAIDEENVLTRRWEMLGGDGSRVGVVLETLLDAQQRRTDAEREYVTAQADYMASLVSLQQAMGTLLQYEGVQAVRAGRSSTVDFIATGHRLDRQTGEPSNITLPPAESASQDTRGNAKPSAAATQDSASFSVTRSVSEGSVPHLRFGLPEASKRVTSVHAKNSTAADPRVARKSEESDSATVGSTTTPSTERVKAESSGSPGFLLPAQPSQSSAETIYFPPTNSGTQS